MIAFNVSTTYKIQDIFGSLLDRFISKKNMAKIGAHQEFLIKRDVARGVDVHGTPFEPYTEKYAEKRAKAGFQTATVDLNMSGQMWASLQVEAQDESVQLFFTGNPAVRAHGLQQDREFFGIHEQELMKDIRKMIDA